MSILLEALSQQVSFTISDFPQKSGSCPTASTCHIQAKALTSNRQAIVDMGGIQQKSEFKALTELVMLGSFVSTHIYWC